MLQLKNHSPFSPAITLFSDENGVDTLYVVVKATFDIGSELSLADEQLPPQKEDEYLDKPLDSSLKYMSEMHLRKPATDIIVNGHAYAPDGQAVAQLDCGIKVGKYSKTIRVFGDRYWQGTQMSQPELFEKMPLIYENAFGGAYIETVEDGKGGYEQKKVQHSANPIGRGLRKRGTEAVNGEKLPNLENPKQLIQLPGDKPEPVGLGFVSAAWKPRVDFSGTYDEEWQKKRAPYLPKDFDNQFFNAATKELIVPDYLKGGETVVMVNLSQQKHLQFQLPECEVKCDIDIAGVKESPEFNMETVLFEPDENRFSITWRAQLNCDKKALKIREVHIRGNWKKDSEEAAA